MKSIAALFATSLLLLVGASGALSASPAGHLSHAAPRAAAPGLRSPLPDTILARVFMARGSADITRREYLKAVRQLGGEPDSLTPGQRRQVLELLVQKRTLAAEATRTGRHWGHSDSVEYRALTDRLTLRAALDSALVELAFAMAARGDTVPDQQVLGIMLRDSAIARQHPVYDEDMLKNLATAFSALPRQKPGMSIQEQIRVAALLPTLASADSARVLVRTPQGAYTAGQLLTDFARLNPSYRPPVRTADQVRDVANSTIYETMLRQAAVRQGLVRRPSIAGALAERAEFLDVQRWVSTYAYEKVPMDSVTLRRHFKGHPELFDTWGRATIVRLVTDTQAAADSLARRLMVPGEAESLASKSMASGVPYGAVLTQDADTTLFARVKRGGVGAVIGPDISPDGWRVLKVMALEGRHPQRFEDAYDLVKNDWYQREGDRRLQEQVRQLQTHTLVNVNDAALARIGKRGPASGVSPHGALPPGRSPHGATSHGMIQHGMTPPPAKKGAAR